MYLLCLQDGLYFVVNFYAQSFFSKISDFLMIWKIIIQNTCVPWQWWFDSLRKHTYAHLCHSSWGRRKRGRLAASFSCAPNVLPLSGMMIMVHMMGDKLLHPLFFLQNDDLNPFYWFNIWKYHQIVLLCQSAKE